MSVYACLRSVDKVLCFLVDMSQVRFGQANHCGRGDAFLSVMDNRLLLTPIAFTIAVATTAIVKWVCEVHKYNTSVPIYGSKLTSLLSIKTCSFALNMCLGSVRQETIASVFALSPTSYRNQLEESVISKCHK